jgi:hypothetical protein
VCVSNPLLIQLRGLKQCAQPTGSNGRDPSDKMDGPCDATTPCQDNTTVCEPLTKQRMHQYGGPKACVPARRASARPPHSAPRKSGAASPQSTPAPSVSFSTAAKLVLFSALAFLRPARSLVKPPSTNVRLECHVGGACATGTTLDPDVNECVTVGDWRAAP